MKHLILALFFLLSFSVYADQGTGSGAGGSPAVFQAIAMKSFLSDENFLLKFNTMNKSMIRSIEFLSAKSGVSAYRVITMKGCEILIETTADDMGTSYALKYGNFICHH